MKSLTISILGLLLLITGCGSKKDPQTAPAQTPQNQPEGNIQLQPVGGPEENTPPSQPMPQPTNPQQQTPPALPQPANPQPQTPPAVPQPTATQPQVIPENSGSEPDLTQPETPQPGSNINPIVLTIAKQAIQKAVPTAVEGIKKGLGILGNRGAQFVEEISKSDNSKLKDLPAVKPFINAAMAQVTNLLGDKKLSDSEKSLLLDYFLDALKNGLKK